MLRLSVALTIYHARKGKLIDQTTSTVVTPFESHPYALIYASHLFNREYQTKLINKLINKNFIIIYFCDKLPNNPTIHKNIIYILSPWRYFDTNTIQDVNLFSCVSGTGRKGKVVAAQYARKFHKPLIYKVEDIKRVTKQIVERKNEKTTILFDTIYQCSDRGLGDILMTTAILEGLKKKFNADITYVCKPRAVPLLECNPTISKVITKYEDADVMNYTYHLPLIRHTEDYKIVRNRQNRYDSMQELFMINLADKDKHPKFYLTEAESTWSREQISEDNSNIKIGINVEATSPSRRWTYDYLLKLITLLNRSNKYTFEIYLFGQGQFIKLDDRVPADINNYVGKTTLRQMIALTSRMDVVLAADSLYGHIAAIFDIPSVIIYTVIPAEWRNKYYRSIGIQGKTKCCPCIDFQFVSCNRYGIPPCTRTITPNIVLSSIYSCIKKYKVNKK